MLEKCKTKESLCRCVDWYKGETADWGDHLLRSYEFLCRQGKEEPMPSIAYKK